jgi:hypothetical protein
LGLWRSGDIVFLRIARKCSEEEAKIAATRLLEALGQRRLG